jgi:hypothetical protein
MPDVSRYKGEKYLDEMVDMAFADLFPDCKFVSGGTFVASGMSIRAIL